MKMKLAFILGVVSLLGFFAGPVYAGGIGIYESGSPDLGTAAAGRAAAASDPSTAFGNPAGMTRLQGTQIEGTLMGVLPSIHFRPNELTTIPGGGADAGVAIPSASAFLVATPSPNSNWRIGVALTSYAGGVLDYTNSWSGRFYVQDTVLITSTLNPSLAYRVNEWLSVGAGVDLVYGYLKGTAAINQPLFTEGSLEAKTDTVGMGGNVGILVEPVQGTRFGLTYRSPVSLDFETIPKVKGLRPEVGAVLQPLINQELDLGLTLPQEVMFSAYHDINDKLAIMANVGWQNWSQFSYTNLEFTGALGNPITVKQIYQDTWHFAIGGQYRLTPVWTLMAGFAYDTSASETVNRDPALPLDRQFRYGIGVQYKCSDQLTIGAAYEFLDAGSAPIGINRGPLSGTLAGEYTSNYINFLALNMIYKF